MPCQAGRSKGGETGKAVPSVWAKNVENYAGNRGKNLPNCKVHLISEVWLSSISPFFNSQYNQVIH